MHKKVFDPGHNADQLPSPRNVPRKRLWELDGRFHCSIVGTCLDPTELRQLCRRSKLVVEAGINNYTLHRACVAIAGESSHASRLLHRHLDRKYRQAIQRFRVEATAEGLTALWRTAVQEGEVAGTYWALVTCPIVPEDLLWRAYGEVHMLSHLGGASPRECNRGQVAGRASQLERRLRRAQAAARDRLREKDERIRSLNKRLRQAEQNHGELCALRERLRMLEDQSLVSRLRDQAEDLAAELALARVRAERAEAALGEWQRFAQEGGERVSRSEAELVEVRRERDALEVSLSGLLSPGGCAATRGSEPVPPDANLCGRCVLFVGGRAAQCPHFRALVERRNGRFIHHDGGREDSRACLGAILTQADAVLCPLDCVSHDAVRRVKRYCERHAKRLVLLPRASLSAFASGLAEVAA